MSQRSIINGLPIIHRAAVKPDWIDYNGHFNAGYYAVVFDDALTGWIEHCGIGREYKAAHAVTSFSVESHITYLRELVEGDDLEITGQLLDHTDKKIHSFLRMFHAGESYLAATYEIMTLHIDLQNRRPAPMRPLALERLEAVGQEQQSAGRPPHVGRVISVEAKSPPAE